MLMTEENNLWLFPKIGLGRSMNAPVGCETSATGFFRKGSHELIESLDFPLPFHPNLDV
jgi:hypothetical protein